LLTDGFVRVHEDSVTRVDQSRDRQGDNPAGTICGALQVRGDLRECICLSLPRPLYRERALAVNIDRSAVHAAPNVRGLAKLRVELGSPQLVRQVELEEDISSLVCVWVFVGWKCWTL